MEMSKFAQTIMEQKYSMQLGDKLETWENISYRVTKNVMRAIGYNMRDKVSQDICKAITEKKFIPGGRYLYASGRPRHQTQNCLMLGVDDSREGWSTLLRKSSMALMTGAGIGVEYSEIRSEGSSIRGTGGKATGPLALMQMLNECGRGIMQGGARRSAIWAGLRWDHPDIHKFIHIKDWPEAIRKLKALDFSFPATLDCTNISVGLNDEFFDSYNDKDMPKHALAQSVYWDVVKQMLVTGEPGFSVNTGANVSEILRNAPVSQDTKVLTSYGYKTIAEIVGDPITIWTGERWASEVVFKKTKCNVQTLKVQMSNGRHIKADPTHEFHVQRPSGNNINQSKINIEKVKASELREGDRLVVKLPKRADFVPSKSMYTLGYIFGDGSFHKKYPRAELTLCTEESKKCLCGLDKELMTSVNENDSRGFTRAYFGNHTIFQDRSKDTYPDGVLSPSFIAGLFDSDGSYDQSRQLLRLASVHKSFLDGVQTTLEFLGIRSNITTGGISSYGGKVGYLLYILSDSVQRFMEIIPTIRIQIQCEDYTPYRRHFIKVESIVDGPIEDVYCCDVKVEEHSFVAEGVVISNCTELCSADTDDICNLGSINMSRIDTIEEFEHIVELAVVFLLAGTVYSDVPYVEVDRVRTKNRRLGLGLMGVHEWLLKRGKPYAPDHDLWTWLEKYKKSTKIANTWADELGLSRPKKTRAIAPCGTISIVAETTSGIEPVFCVSYKRRYLKHKTWHYQYVIDPTAKRLIDNGVNPESIEDAYDLSCNVERRVHFQQWIQQAVDHSISSTVNLPHWGSEQNNENTVQPFGHMLMKYLPDLRGITCFPDGGRSGQPLTPVRYKTAIKHIGEVIEESTDICDITKGGSCGE